MPSKPSSKASQLFTGTLLALFAVYMLWWRTNFCAKMMLWNAAIPPQDLDNYLMRRLTQREVCGLGDYAASAFMLMLGIIIATYAWHTLRRPSKAVPG
jgi:hypothetical protein